MSAQPFQIIGSEVIKDSQVPGEMVLYVVSFGKSTDTKPTQANYKLAMGSSAFEIDTGDKYFWDTENEEWIKPGASGGD